jgi:4-nitrophenyl phosphatase
VFDVVTISLHNHLYTMSPPFLKTPEEYRQLVDSVDTFLLDCDGVIYHGPEVVEGVKEVLTMFRAAGTSLRSL